jgi:hypothetical protein
MKMRAANCVGLWRATAPLILALFFSLPVAAQSIVIAMVTDLDGKVALMMDGKSEQAQILSDIAVGSKVQLESGTKFVVLYLEGGAEFTFTGPAQIEFKAEKPEVVSGSAPTIRNPSLIGGVRLKPVGLGQGALVLRNATGGARIRLISANGTRVLETQPEFRWQVPEAGLKYHVEITDDSGRSLHDGQVDTNAFFLPAGLQLKDGMSYMWEVSSRLPDGRKYSSVGVFSVATSDLRAQAAAMLSETTSAVASRVAYAIWLEQMELKDEARKYWRSLLIDRPEEPLLKALAN